MNATNLCRPMVQFVRLCLVAVFLLGSSGCGVGEYERRLEITRTNGWPKDKPVVVQEDLIDETTEEDDAAAADVEETLERLRRLNELRRPVSK